MILTNKDLSKPWAYRKHGISNNPRNTGRLIFAMVQTVVALVLVKMWVA